MSNGSNPNAQLYRAATRIFSVVILLFGVVIVVRTITAGGGITSIGLLIGLVFCALGAGRLYLATRGGEVG